MAMNGASTVLVRVGLLAAIASAQQTLISEEESSIDYQYMVYLSRFSKSHRSLTEYDLRLAEFKKTQVALKAQNDHHSTSIVGNNAYSDWTDDERLNHLSFGLSEDRRDHQHMFEHYARLTTQHLPDYVNWLEEGAISPVKEHHHHCASAWAHTAAAVIEGDFYIRTGVMDVLSSQQFIDCDEHSLGCHGGQYVNAFEYAIDNPVMLAKDYPWTGENQDCLSDSA
jgi:C1A family cysteine protease